MDKIILHVKSGYFAPALKAAYAAGVKPETRVVGQEMELIAPAWAETAIKKAVPRWALGAERHVRATSAAKEIANVRYTVGLF